MEEKEVQYLVQGVWRPSSFSKVVRGSDRRQLEDRRSACQRGELRCKKSDYVSPEKEASQTNIELVSHNDSV